jgi:hypothetical protein
MWSARKRSPGAGGQGLQRFAEHPHAAGAGHRDAGEQPEQGALAAAARPLDEQPLAVPARSSSSPMVAALAPTAATKRSKSLESACSVGGAEEAALAGDRPFLPPMAEASTPTSATKRSKSVASSISALFLPSKMLTLVNRIGEAGFSCATAAVATMASKTAKSLIPNDDIILFLLAKGRYCDCLDVLLRNPSRTTRGDPPFSHLSGFAPPSSIEKVGMV